MKRLPLILLLSFCIGILKPIWSQGSFSIYPFLEFQYSGLDGDIERTEYYYYDGFISSSNQVRVGVGISDQKHNFELGYGRVHFNVKADLIRNQLKERVIAPFIERELSFSQSITFPEATTRFDEIYFNFQRSFDLNYFNLSIGLYYSYLFANYDEEIKNYRYNISLISDEYFTNQSSKYHNGHRYGLTGGINKDFFNSLNLYLNFSFGAGALILSSNGESTLPSRKVIYDIESISTRFFEYGVRLGMKFYIPIKS